MEKYDQILAALAAQNEERQVMVRDLKSLAETVKEFQDTYLVDMRGEGKVNGFKGLIAEVQWIKDEVVKHPSISSWAARQPYKALVSAIGGFIGAVTLWFALHALASIPAVEAWFLKLLGLP